MIHTPPANITYILGKALPRSRPLSPFAPVVCSFLAALDVELRHDERSRDFPDILTFAFWCRAGNIEKLKTEYLDGKTRLGRGLAFHVAPSNVPVNFAFSFAFSLLAGNANIVRVPSRDFPQVTIICSAIENVLVKPEFSVLRDMMAFVRYPSDSAVTAKLSAQCDARIIWGGNETVSEIRKMPIPPRCVELIFPDRYSFCALDAGAVLAASTEELTRLADGFYNDTYLMDQNACSSPHLIVWQGAGVGDAKKRFWDAVRKVVSLRYKIAAVQAVDKYTMLLEYAASAPLKEVKQLGTDIYTVGLEVLPAKLDDLRGKFGLFYEFDADDLNVLAPLVTNKFQTLTYFGVDKNKLASFVTDNHLTGIDRIVPVGQALDVGVIWDGYDIIRQLSRIVDVR